MNTLPTYTTIATFGSAASKIQPDATTYSGGYLAGQRFPAQHENYFMNGLTGNGNTLITQVNSVQNELNNWLAYFSVSPSGSDTQIRDLFNTRMALKLDSSSYTAADVLSKLLTVDTDTSGLNATTLKSITIGQSGTSYIPYVDASGGFLIGTANSGLNTALQVRTSSTNIAQFSNGNYVQGSAGTTMIVYSGASTGNAFMGLGTYVAGGATPGNLVFNQSGGTVIINSTESSFADAVLKVASSTAKSTTATKYMAYFGSSDVSSAMLGLSIVQGGNATASSRFMGLQSSEEAAGARALSLQSAGGQVWINRTTDDSSGALLQVNGGISGNFLGTLATGVTGVTQAYNDNSTKIATTAFVTSNALSQANGSSYSDFSSFSTATTVTPSAPPVYSMQFVKIQKVNSGGSANNLTLSVPATGTYGFNFVWYTQASLGSAPTGIGSGVLNGGSIGGSVGTISVQAGQTVVFSGWFYRSA